MHTYTHTYINITNSKTQHPCGESKTESIKQSIESSTKRDNLTGQTIMGDRPEKTDEFLVPS